ncbi:MAG TPA: 5-dehydro-2-deoxygluconokinase [Ktedonobacteraceae bacterium]|jgi:5-dehydro-2-deoxygluconokinase|nr:5-dehydro-2-deoxygluconokinase [Ktedonobacteraceae bacterium]
METHKKFDVITMGRSSIDLYSNDVGAPFVEISSFAAYVGGCPTNISVGTRRLGLNVALLTAVGDDQVGDFILHFLKREGVDTQFILHKPGLRSSAVVLGIEPPDRFPLTYYRENCADVALTIDDVLVTPIAEARVLLISGTGLSKEPSRSATLFAAELAQQAGVTVMLDIDFRPDQWHDPRAFGIILRSALRLIDVVIGTEDEINAVMLTDSSQINLTHSQVSDARVSGDSRTAIHAMLNLGPRLLIQKRGADSSLIHMISDSIIAEPQVVPGFPVEVKNILGAGDGFAAGVLYGFVNGWDWYKTVRLANACGAILVTQHGCANFMPTYDEVMTFIQKHGGF